MRHDETGVTLNLHAVLSASRSNGPGTRYVIWFQGCTLGCSGCFNPETHTAEASSLITVSELMWGIHQVEHRIEGITISGGEPLQQPQGLLRLLCTVRRETELTILLFSGYQLSEIERWPFGKALLAELDVLIAGRYQRERHLGMGLRGSSNQTIHLLSERYTLREVEATLVNEIHIQPGGTVLITGIGGVSVRNPSQLTE